MFSRNSAIQRTRSLLSRRAVCRAQNGSSLKAPETRPETNAGVHVCFEADVGVSPVFLAGCSIALFVTTAAVLSRVFAPVFVPLFSFLVAALPYSWVQSRANRRAAEFSSDYPSILLAAASSLKTGMTPLGALERSVQLLKHDSILRQEVERLLARIGEGVPKEQAIGEFGRSVRLADLALFRSAFLLVLENGGRFGPTLERLAQVTRDRNTLISSARVSTAVMRMTANFLLVVAPIVVLMVAARTPNYWDTFRTNAVANTLGTAGAAIIAASYFVLRFMSSFRP